MSDGDIDLPLSIRCAELAWHQAELCRASGVSFDAPRA
jgi:hypothetical protein